MPLNCPVAETMQCQGCRYCTDGKCWWFFPALDLAEILTVQERLVELELPDKQKPIYFVPKQMDTINQLKAQTLYLEGKLNEHIDRSKKKREDVY